ncbi:MAG: 5-(carboxyamino)imidazole ribonucleotide synthase, partial [Brevibacterium aurantiacum]|nr:5-(carboxyamino)imidazole ribonucleotide synthase [Brevibacterium aurantiacum]
MTFPRVGVIGGGQLARMLAPAAEALGIRFSVLAETADAPATQVINEVSVGDYTDFATLKAFAETVDVVTFDHEHVPPEHLQALAEAGHAIRPGPQALIFAQDKILMRRRMDELGLPNPAWAEITSRSDIEAFADRVG